MFSEIKVGLPDLKEIINEVAVEKGIESTYLKSVVLCRLLRDLNKHEGGVNKRIKEMIDNIVEKN